MKSVILSMTWSCNIKHTEINDLLLDFTTYILGPDVSSTKHNLLLSMCYIIETVPVCAGHKSIYLSSCCDDTGVFIFPTSVCHPHLLLLLTLVFSGPYMYVWPNIKPNV